MDYSVIKFSLTFFRCFNLLFWEANVLFFNLEMSLEKLSAVVWEKITIHLEPLEYHSLRLSSKRIHPSLQQRMLPSLLSRQSVKQILERNKEIQFPFFSLIETYVSQSSLESLAKYSRKDEFQRLFNYFTNSFPGWFDPSSKSQIFLRFACRCGLFDVVQYLLQFPNVDVTVKDWVCFRDACANGYLDIVQLLLRHPRVDPAALNNQSIQWASENGHFQVVQLLLQYPTVDPICNDYHCIRKAIENDHRDVLIVFLNDQRVDPNLVFKLHGILKFPSVVQILLNHRKMNLDTDLNSAFQLSCEQGYF
jgi:hypothetical protein